jgi:molecular chaperone GrpE
MSEFTPPSVPASVPGTDAPGLTDTAIEAVLADFRTWLQQLATLPPAPPDGAAGPPLDLHTLLAQFIALRHEVNLQTKATRAQQEQNAETLRQLSAAVEMLPQEAPDSDEALRPLLKTLIDLYDALALAERECRRVREAILPSLDRLAQSAPPLASPAPPWWARWLGRGQQVPPAPPDRSPSAEAAQAIRPMLDSLVIGYTMSVQRLDRALRQHGLEPIATVGQPFDPERMEVVEVVTTSDRPSGEVVVEMRRGYLWRDQVFRFAQVSVAKGSVSGE